MNSPVVFITGAGKGIGQACVRELIRRSKTQGERAAPAFKPQLFLTSRTKSDLDLLLGEAKAAGLNADALAVDLADAPTAAIEACIQNFGRVDLCLHSAGVGRFGNFLELTADDLQFVMRTNVEASFLLMQATYAQMKKQKSGMIQWITSVAAEKAFEHSAIYGMSKFAQRGLLEVMRLYGYQDGIRIVDVKPGAVFTPMWGEVTAQKQALMMAPGDIAQAMIDAYFLPTRTSVEEITLRPLHGDLSSD